jgi:hypothetical protein
MISYLGDGSIFPQSNGLQENVSNRVCFHICVEAHLANLEAINLSEMVNRRLDSLIFAYENGHGQGQENIRGYGHGQEHGHRRIEGNGIF